MLNKMKPAEIESLALFKIIEHIDNGQYFYMKNGKLLTHCQRFSFDIQITKDISTKGKVSFSIDSGNEFKIFNKFKDVIDYLKSLKITD